MFIEAAVARTTRVEQSAAATPLGVAPVVLDPANGTFSGGVGVAGDIESHRHSASLTGTWRMGAHAFRAGVQYEQLYLDQSIDAARTGAGGTITRQSENQWSWHSVLAEHGQAENRMPSVFIQDAWQVGRRTLLNVGARWSRQTIYNLTSDTVSFRTDDGLQPRLGIVYQPGTLGTQRVYASFARVANQIVLWGAEANGFGAETLFVFPRDPRVDTTGGAIAYTLPRGGGLTADGTLRGETADEWALGYGRRLSGRFDLGVRAVRRSHRDAVQAGRDVAGTVRWGNPGLGSLEHFPRPHRTYYALELVIEHAGGSRSPWLRVSYVLSRTHGNYPGLYGSDWRLDFAHFGPLYFVPEQHLNGTGLLPNDRTHVLKLFGSQPIGSRLTVGGTFLLASGTPLSEYGALSMVPPPFRVLVRPRGTSGRTSMIWDLGVRVAYEPLTPWSTSARTRVLLDIEHIGSPRDAVDFDQIRFTCVDAGGNQSCPNAGYGRAIYYQPPMTARLGIEAGF
jgi:hypothetical protein